MTQQQVQKFTAQVGVVATTEKITTQPPDQEADEMMHIRSQLNDFIEERERYGVEQNIGNQNRKELMIPYFIMITFAESRLHGSLADVLSMIVICLEWSANFLLGWNVCSWLEEINRRQAEMVAARVSVEKMRQRNQALTTENENLKVLAEDLSCSTL